jgi:hypothetical protein
MLCNLQYIGLLLLLLLLLLSSSICIFCVLFVFYLCLCAGFITGTYVVKPAR